MRLIVQDEQNEFSRQTHAYAEYRAFSGLVGHDADVADVTVELRRPAGENERHDDERVVCTITVRMTSGEIERALAVTRHAYAAIDRAVSLLRAEKWV
jgi:ribosome-associated translation inhibitor RaiA